MVWQQEIAKQTKTKQKSEINILSKGYFVADGHCQTMRRILFSLLLWLMLDVGFGPCHTGIVIMLWKTMNEDQRWTKWIVTYSQQGALLSLGQLLKLARKSQSSRQVSSIDLPRNSFHHKTVLMCCRSSNECSRLSK